MAQDFRSPSRSGSRRIVELCARCRDAEGGRKDKPGGIFVDRNRLSLETSHRVGRRLEPDAAANTKTCIDHIRDAGTVRQRPVDDLLLCRIQAGALKLRGATIDPRCLIQELERQFRFKAATKGLRLQEVPGADRSAALGPDSDRLRQLLGNLLGNAVRYIQGGEVPLHQFAEAISDAYLTLVAEVRSNGARDLRGAPGSRGSDPQELAVLR